MTFLQLSEIKNPGKYFQIPLCNSKIYLFQKMVYFHISEVKESLKSVISQHIITFKNLRN